MSREISPFSPYEQLCALAESAGHQAELEVAAWVDLQERRLPIGVLSIGNQDPLAPGVAFVGGVHGLERIGTEVTLAFLRNLIRRLPWDVSVQQLLERVRLIFIPAVNPGGLMTGRRSNPRGVDLMRNAPVDAKTKVPFLIGGHRISPKLPWYRGAEGAAMEVESTALCKVIREKLFGRPLSIAMDCHSGFGIRDRIWFPYARQHEPPEHLPEAFALRQLFNDTFPQHSFYLMEPQSVTYCTHGDLWDYLYDEHLHTQRGIFLPFTLEMGSWMWVQKNPRQLFSLFGHFNPVLPHRFERVLRRHLTLFNFLAHAAAAGPYWLPDPVQREEYLQAAKARWYPAQAASTP